MPAVEVLSELRSRGYIATIQGDRLKLRGPCRLSPDLERRIADCRDELVGVIRKEEERRQDTAATVAAVGEVLELAREVLPELKEEDRVDLDELIQANSPPAPGRDPMAKHGTDKARFFQGDWREAWPRDFRANGEGSS